MALQAPRVEGGKGQGARQRVPALVWNGWGRECVVGGQPAGMLPPGCVFPYAANSWEKAQLNTNLHGIFGATVPPVGRHSQVRLS